MKSIVLIALISSQILMAAPISNREGANFGYAGNDSKIERFQRGASNVTLASNQLNLNKWAGGDGFVDSGCPTPTEPLFEQERVYRPTQSYYNSSNTDRPVPPKNYVNKIVKVSLSVVAAAGAFALGTMGDAMGKTNRPTTFIAAGAAGATTYLILSLFDD